MVHSLNICISKEHGLILQYSWCRTDVVLLCVYDLLFDHINVEAHTKSNFKSLPFMIDVLLRNSMDFVADQCFPVSETRHGSEKFGFSRKHFVACLQSKKSPTVSRVQKALKKSLFNFKSLHCWDKLTCSQLIGMQTLLYAYYSILKNS